MMFIQAAAIALLDILLENGRHLQELPPEFINQEKHTHTAV